jgi:hypothetical protein
MSLRPESRPLWFEPRVVAVAIVATAVVWSISIVVAGWKAVEAPGAAPRTLDVEATATRPAIPDRVTWSIVVRGHGVNRDAALQDLSDTTTSVLGYLADHDITDNEISLKIIDTTREDTAASSDDGVPDVTRVELSREIAVVSTDVTRVTEVARDAPYADALVDADVGEPACSLSYVDALAQVVLDDARASVRVRAERAIEQYGGAHLGRLASAKVGSVDTGGTDCASFEVSATASATYELE